MSYIITIPEPCTENWNTMAPTQKGAFCDKCSKEVVDFTHTSRFELSKKLESGTKLCGRFKPSQLNTPIPSVSQNTWKRNAAMLGFTSLLAIGSPVAAQQTKPALETVEEEIVTLGDIAIVPIAQENITIHGNVKDLEFPLPGATVVLKNSTVGTQTDFDGNFSLTLPASEIQSLNTLVISHIGYITKEIAVDRNTPFLEITFADEEIEYMGGLVIIERQNIFKRIGNLFRRRD
ncbi:hypothetical protein GGR42_000181 [Saonia flava]|uniref:CarboxypepD_reg-like domain-containing protein n=1 Tax=Saonia flava TaxID=523696 RepID=A0A846QYM5_9FLAO|nr:carboxypeptidase-like regulatory domain-containing protein [Saonia flava]NJB69719.1 hypothetical protein [Saonia flava]